MTGAAAADHASVDQPPFSLMQGGLLYRAGLRLGTPRGTRGLIYLGLGLAGLTWLPLLIFSATEGTIFDGRTVPFLAGTGPHMRLLLGIPLFFLAEAGFDIRIGQVTSALIDSHLIPERRRPDFDATLLKASRWRDTGLIEIAALAITILFAVKGFRSELPATISTWRNDVGGGLNLAGWWYVAVSVPIYQFLMMRWVVHLAIWVWLLRRISRLDLRLLPTHPDLAGGLGILAVAHVALAPLNFALLAILTGDYADHLHYAAADARDLLLRVGFAVLASTFALIAPLLVFIPRLLAAKQRGLLEYGDLATTYVRAFDAKWLRGANPSDEPLLGTADVQSLADLGNSYDVIRQMKVVPITRGQVLFLAGAAAVPALPLVNYLMPFDEMMIHGVRTLLHM
jgi:hypothetical protein